MHAELITRTRVPFVVPPKKPRYILALDVGEVCGFVLGSNGFMALGTWHWRNIEAEIAEPADMDLFDVIYCTSSGRPSPAKIARVKDIAARLGFDVIVEKWSDVRESFTGSKSATRYDMEFELQCRAFGEMHEKNAGAIALFDLALQR